MLGPMELCTVPSQLQFSRKCGFYLISFAPINRLAFLGLKPWIPSTRAVPCNQMAQKTYWRIWFQTHARVLYPTANVRCPCHVCPATKRFPHNNAFRPRPYITIFFLLLSSHRSYDWLFWVSRTRLLNLKLKPFFSEKKGGTRVPKWEVALTKTGYSPNAELVFSREGTSPDVKDAWLAADCYTRSLQRWPVHMFNWGYECNVCYSSAQESFQLAGSLGWRVWWEISRDSFFCCYKISHSRFPWSRAEDSFRMI